MSAIFNRLSGLVPCSGASAMPMLVPILTSLPSISNGFAKISIIRSASSACGFALVGFAALNDGKFVAAEPCQHVGFPQQRLEPGRCLPQQRVARGMAERIVDVLEAVEIEQQHGERIAAPALARRRFFDLLRHRGTIGQTRQRVMMRHERDALLRFLAFGDVVDDDDQIFRLAVIVADDDAAGRINARRRPGYRRRIRGSCRRSGPAEPRCPCGR